MTVPPAAEPADPPDVPAWITDPDLIADILAGHALIDDDFLGDTQ